MYAHVHTHTRARVSARTHTMRTVKLWPPLFSHSDDGGPLGAKSNQDDEWVVLNETNKEKRKKSSQEATRRLAS